MGQLAFEALYHGDRLHPVNPTGDVGLIILWTRIDAALRKLAEIDPALLDPARSRIAVVSNLYGDGMYAMFCNLLHNPQVRHLVAIGEPLGQPTTDELRAFLDHGVETATVLGTEVTRIVGTNRIFPQSADFPADRLRDQLSFRWFGKFSDPEAGKALLAYLEEEPPGPPVGEDDRVTVELPRFDATEYEFRPSDVLGHDVRHATPLACWRELVTRVARFGRPVTLGGETRLELLNVKAVVTDPRAEPADELAEHGFDLAAFRDYQESILRPELPAGLTYTYGNRMRGHHGFDALEAAGRLLAADPETREARVQLWDTGRDMTDPGSVPCLTTLFFLMVDGRLEMTATYRAHNLLIAWMQNVYGLMAVQRFVARIAGLEPGPITVISHSLGINPGSPRYALGRRIAAEWAPDEPAEHFTVAADHADGLVVVDDRRSGKRYRADRPAKIQREIIGDLAVDDVATAMWLGGELRRAEDLSRLAALPPPVTAGPAPMRSHAVSRADLTQCWQELVTRVVRFGRPVTLRDGRTVTRLTGVRAVITGPVTPRGDEPVPAEAITAGELLRTDPGTRHAYLAMGDAIFFRVSDGRLTLTATRHEQDLLGSWRADVEGLAAIRQRVAEIAGLPAGPVTVLSHVLTVGTGPAAREIAAGWRTDEDIDPATGRHVLREDPNGYFVVSADQESGTVVAEHRYEGLLLKQYRAGTAAEVRREIVRDLAVSVVSHALWVGRELQRAEDTLRIRRKS